MNEHTVTLYWKNLTLESEVRITSPPSNVLGGMFLSLHLPICTMGSTERVLPGFQIFVKGNRKIGRYEIL